MEISSPRGCQRLLAISHWPVVGGGQLVVDVDRYWLLTIRVDLVLADS
jgi:hypothetical protein